MVYPPTSGKGEGPVLAIVADGMGGHVAGDLASKLAVEAATSTPGTPVERVAMGNRAIIEEAARRPHLAGMGTTMTLSELASDGQMRIAHVGDSRAYLLRAGRLIQLTTDHTVVAEYVATGKIEPAEAVTHPQRSMLTRALGLGPEIEIDEIVEQLLPGDRLLLCSDGLPAMVPDSEIQTTLLAVGAEEAAWSLVEMANKAGGVDNVTALVVDVEQ
jgi:protein phosphatase